MAFELQSELQREDYYATLEQFLLENFHLPQDRSLRKPDHYPPLPLLISLLDTAIDHNHSFSSDWSVERLRDVRAALEYMIFALLEHQLRHLSANYYHRFLDRLSRAEARPPTVISLNYDIIVDNSMIRLGEEVPFGNGFGVPEYGCDVATESYCTKPKFGELYKLHGSLNWLYCPSCHRLDVGISKSGRYMSKMLEQLYTEISGRDDGGSLEARYSCHGSPCLDCGTFVHPVLITPTHLKDYRNPHIAQTWYKAERALRKASRAYLIGYSLPEDDVDVIYLLKKGLSHLAADKITVVDFDTQRREAREHPAGSRYCTLFGDDIRWHPEGFSDWLAGWQP
jgi:hypothetical protein